MKRLIKSVLLLSMVVGVVGFSSRALFSSSVTSTDNVITTGTLMAAVDSTQNHTSVVGTWTFPNAYNVVRDVDGNIVVGDPLESWTGAAPNDVFSYWVAVRNRGTVPFTFIANAVGDWETLPRIGTAACNADGIYTVADADQYLVSVTNIHRYAATPTGGCESNIECQNIRNALIGLGTWTTATTAGADDLTPAEIMAGDGTVIGANEFAIYRVYVQLGDADNCYQGATYNFDFTVDATQI